MKHHFVKTFTIPLSEGVKSLAMPKIKKGEIKFPEMRGRESFYKKSKRQMFTDSFISFSPMRLSALKIVSLVLSTGTKIDAQ